MYKRQIIDMFDTIGTLVGTASRAGMVDKEGNMPNMKEALIDVYKRQVMEQAEWKIMPHAIDLIANGRVSVEDGHVMIDEK